TAKNEFGLDHNETRSWHGWHRHVSLVMLAFAMLAAIRRRINEWLETEASESKKELHGSKQRTRADSVVNPRNPTSHSTPYPIPN
ncbi:MAG: hypothetical protein LBM75_00100, partial [Myxococcales bacterium]|nr:hypothetical protein [Myxococcales bacterium]